jgi:hypothetical protein
MCLICFPGTSNQFKYPIINPSLLGDLLVPLCLERLDQRLLLRAESHNIELRGRSYPSPLRSNVTVIRTSHLKPINSRRAIRLGTYCRIHHFSLQCRRNYLRSCPLRSGHLLMTHTRLTSSYPGHVHTVVQPRLLPDFNCRL